mgnify:CR=1 FL=1
MTLPSHCWPPAASLRQRKGLYVKLSTLRRYSAAPFGLGE